MQVGRQNRQIPPPWGSRIRMQDLSGLRDFSSGLECYEKFALKSLNNQRSRKKELGTLMCSLTWILLSKKYYLKTNNQKQQKKISTKNPNKHA